MSTFSSFFPTAGGGGGGTGITGNSNVTVGNVTYTNVITTPDDPLFYPLAYYSDTAAPTTTMRTNSLGRLAANGSVANTTTFNTAISNNLGGSTYNVTTAGVYETAVNVTYANGGFLCFAMGPRLTTGAELRMRITVDGTAYEYIYGTAGGGAINRRLAVGFVRPIAGFMSAAGIDGAPMGFTQPFTDTNNDTTNNVQSISNTSVTSDGNSSGQYYGRTHYLNMVPTQGEYVRDQLPKLYFSSTLKVEHQVDVLSTGAEGAKTAAIVHQII